MFRRRRLIDILFGESEVPKADTNPSTYNPNLEYLANRFRMGIARAIGIPPEYIDEEKVRRWVENWVKAFVRPEHWSRVLGSPGGYEMEWLGYELGSIISQSFGRKVKKK